MVTHAQVMLPLAPRAHILKKYEFMKYRAANFWELLGIKTQKLAFDPQLFLVLTCKKKKGKKERKNNNW